MIVIDTREKKPLIFDSNIQTTLATLKTGDYAFMDSSGSFMNGVIECKHSKSDLWQTLTKDYDRFRRELLRMQDFKFRFLLIAIDKKNILKGFYYNRGDRHIKSKKSGRQILKQLATIKVKYKVEVICLPNKTAVKNFIQVLYKRFKDGTMD